MKESNYSEECTQGTRAGVEQMRIPRRVYRVIEVILPFIIIIFAGGLALLFLGLL